MHVTSYSVGQYVEKSFQRNMIKQDSHADLGVKENNLNSPWSASENSLRIKAYKDSSYLRQIQNDFNETLWANSYLGKLQKVLERFREYNRKIAEKVLSPEASEASKQAQNFSQNIDRLIKEFPLLKEVVTELGNLKVKSFIGTISDEVNSSKTVSKRETSLKLISKIDKAIAKVSGKRFQLSNHLDKLEKLVTQNQEKPRLSDISGMKMPSNLFSYLKPDKTVELLS